jgi:hypothetical protein
MAGQEWEWWAECDDAPSTTEATYPSLDSSDNAKASQLSREQLAIGGESMTACGEVVNGAEDCLLGPAAL